MGDPRAHLGDPQDPGRRRRAAAPRPRRRDRDLVQRRRRDRGGSPLVGAGRCGRAGRDRQRLDPPRPRSAAGPDRRLRAVQRRGRGRPVSTKLELPDPPADAARVPWALRSTDLDANGHVNNAVYWQAVEDWCPREGLDPPHRIAPSSTTASRSTSTTTLELASFGQGGATRCLAFVVADRVKAVASVGPAL